eukprot:SAG11_NODE_42551_length_178_cov_76.848101_1_plen_20_part_10
MQRANYQELALAQRRAQRRA